MGMGMEEMTAYEFYVKDTVKEKKLIGILPERRKNPERITEDSIMNWAKLTFGSVFAQKDIYFERVTLRQNGDGIYYTKEWSLTAKAVAF